jgi:hypothetical protein
MAPISEPLSQSLDQDRYQHAEWRSFELWEKIREKKSKQRRVLFLVTLLIALGISSIPVILDSEPYWKARAVLGEVSRTWDEVRLQSAIRRKPHRMVIEQGDSYLSWRIEEVETCESPAPLREIQSFRGPEGYRLLGRGRQVHCSHPTLGVLTPEFVLRLVTDRDLTPEGAEVRSDRVAQMKFSQSAEWVED